MTSLASKMGCVRKDGILMTKEEAAAGYKHGNLSSMESLRADAKKFGISERPGHSLRLAVALARAGSNDTPAPLTARNMPTARTVVMETANPKASTSKPRDRVKVVAHAVANDPALQSKAGDAINLLADSEYEGVTGEGIVKLLKAGATHAPDWFDLAAKAAKTSAPAKAAAARTNPTANPKSNGLWDNAIAKLNGAKPAPLNTSKAASGAWDNVIARMNRANGFTN